MKLLHLLFLPLAAADSGGLCAGCTIVVGLLLGRSKPVPIPPVALKAICAQKLSIAGIGDASGLCEAIASDPAAAELIAHHSQLASSGLPSNPDLICRTISLCKDEQKQCTLYGWKTPALGAAAAVSPAPTVAAWADAAASGLALKARGGVVDHLPEFDHDKDRYSTVATLRGSNWRGKDCDDKDSTVYPGRRGADGGASSCNGIGAADQDRLCAASERRGVLLLGDSAGAHFSVPFHHTDNFSLADWAQLAEDELDYPECSWATGHLAANATAIGAIHQCPYSSMPLDSLYLRLRDRNRCNHRDFQNVGVNGARSTSMCRQAANASCGDGIITSLARDKSNDYPVLAIYSLVGNDVCNGHTNQSDPMTKPDEFKSRLDDALAHLNATLPAGSHLVLIGLLDGRMMYETMAPLVHPALSPITYDELYGFLNCLETNPCFGFLNSNSTWRDFTANRAEQLNQVLRDAAAAGGYSTLQTITYVDYPINRTTVAQWAAAGKNPAELFEAVGGGHPSQTSHALTAAAVWAALEARAPAALGPVNPNNAEIAKVYGDQGGY